ncbi:hypothetical protein Tco_0890749 [Tanacetum coccineum]|uniref:Uncharacterized protein n=1 Tax=Tanacetum coccineum TaxID=301880 RepID=A0ABQ5C370_9ASTR
MCKSYGEVKVRKKEKAYEDEKYAAACRYMLSATCDDEDDYIPLVITPDLPIEEPDNSINLGGTRVLTLFRQRNQTNLEEVIDEKTIPLPSWIVIHQLLLFFSDNSLPEFESFSDHTEETRSGSTTTHANYSFSEYESFHFDDQSFPRPPPKPPDVEICSNFESDSTVINNFDVLNNDESFDPREGENVVFLNDEEDDSFTFTIRTFLPFVTYPEVTLLSAPRDVKIRSLTPASPFRAGGLSSGWNFHIL